MSSNRLLRIFLAAALAASSACSCGSDERERPNLVVVVIDTLRPDHLGCYGYSRALSPNLDHVASESVLFENAQSASPWTAPALLSLMTSLYPSVHQVREFPSPGRMNERATTLAEMLKAHGYATAAFTEGGYAKGAFGLDQGFDMYAKNEGDDESNSSNLTHPSRLAGNVDRTLAWLRENRARPFFLFFHTYEVHGPYRAPESFVREVRPDWDERAEHERVATVIERWNSERDIDRDGAVLLANHNLHCGFEGLPAIGDAPALRRTLNERGLAPGQDGSPFFPETLAFVRDQYDAEVRYTDEQLARLWSALDELGLSKDTVLVVTSDHGEGLGEHHKIGHGSLLHDELMRVLLLVRAPELGAGRVSQMVRSVDVVPTVLELLGVSASGVTLQGQSLGPLLAGKASELPAYGQALSIHGEETRWHSLREGEWRLLVDDVEKTAALFDLGADPGETKDVSAAHEEVVQRLRAELEKQRETDAILTKLVSGEVQARDLTPEEFRDLERLGYVGK